MSHGRRELTGNYGINSLEHTLVLLIVYRVVLAGSDALVYWRTGLLHRKTMGRAASGWPSRNIRAFWPYVAGVS